MFGTPEILKYYIDSGVNMNVMDVSYMYTPLHHTAGNPDSRFLKHLVTVPDINLEMFGDWGYKPIHVAALKRLTKNVKILADAGADINSVDFDIETPMFLAIRNDDIKMVKLLVSLGARIETPNKKGQTPLLYAKELGHNDIYDFLISKGASPDFPQLPIAEFEDEEDFVERSDGIMYNVLHMLLEYGEDKPIIHLMKLGEGLLDKDKETSLLINHIVNRDNYDMLKTIQSYGGLKLDDPVVWSNLLHASTYNNDTMVLERILRDKSTDIDTINDDGFTPLMLAVLHANPNPAKLFLEYGANPNIETDTGISPFVIIKSRMEKYKMATKDKEIYNLLTDAGVDMERELTDKEREAFDELEY